MSNTTVQFREFSAHDFKIDPEPFANGAPCLIADIDVDGYPAAVIIDGAGVAFWWDDDAARETLEYLVPNPYAARALPLLKPSMTKAELIALGAKKL